MVVGGEGGGGGVTVQVRVGWGSGAGEGGGEGRRDVGSGTEQQGEDCVLTAWRGDGGVAVGGQGEVDPVAGEREGVG